MKRRFGRELFWLSLPVLLLGGLALHKSRGGPLAALSISNPFDMGPMRLEFSDFSSLQLTPLDAALGNDWGVQTNVKTVGRLDVPSTWRDNGEWGATNMLHLAYREGKVWKQIFLPVGSGFSSVGPTKIKVNLKVIPRDAEEVRLRGQFQDIKAYRGAIPRGWIAPKNVHHAGLNHSFTISSKPFDVLIKGSNQDWPAPVVSHQQKIEVVGGKWLHDTEGEHLLLWVRAKPDSEITGEVNCRLDHVRYFDATGKSLRVYQDATSTVPADIQGSTRKWMSYDMPDNEDIVWLAQPTAQPRGGWGKVKMPITVTGLASDGECWPTPFKVHMAPEVGEVRDYGAPQRPDTSGDMALTSAKVGCRRAVF